MRAINSLKPELAPAVGGWRRWLNGESNGNSGNEVSNGNSPQHVLLLAPGFMNTLAATGGRSQPGDEGGQCEIPHRSWSSGSLRVCRDRRLRRSAGNESSSHGNPSGSANPEKIGQPKGSAIRENKDSK
jgi:hypothetical protein